MQQDYHHQYPSCPYLNGHYYCPRPYYYPSTPAPAPEPMPTEPPPETRPASPSTGPVSGGPENAQPIRPVQFEVPAKEEGMSWTERARIFFLRILGLDNNVEKDLRSDGAY